MRIKKYYILFNKLKTVNIKKRPELTDVLFVLAGLALASFSVIFPNPISSIPLLVVMVFTILPFTLKAAYRPDPSGAVQELHVKIDKLDERTKRLKEEIENRGETVDPDEMLDYYNDLKKDATEFGVFWSLDFGDHQPIKQYLREEVELLHRTPELTIRRIIDMKVDRLLLSYIDEHYEMIKEKHLESRYGQRFGDNFPDIEIGYSICYNKDQKLHYKKALIIIGHARTPKVGFFYDTSIKGTTHEDTVNGIKGLFESAWVKATEVRPVDGGKQILESPRQIDNTISPSTQTNNTSTPISQPSQELLQILKLRLVKGEITKEEFDDMKKIASASS